MRSHRAGRSRRSLRSRLTSRARSALVSLGSCLAGGTLRALWPSRSRRASGSVAPALPLRPLRAFWACRPLGSLGSLRTFWPLGSWGADVVPQSSRKIRPSDSAVDDAGRGHGVRSENGGGNGIAPRQQNRRRHRGGNRNCHGGREALLSIGAHGDGLAHFPESGNRYQVVVEPVVTAAVNTGGVRVFSRRVVRRLQTMCADG